MLTVLGLTGTKDHSTSLGYGPAIAPQLAGLATERWLESRSTVAGNDCSITKASEAASSLVLQTL
ncbi:MAG: hypothetical protein CBB71_19450 [Rhodopirellula sp. TMED11]|nr:MAG: hypothetical protein CBB71_19450 [Rhodopirellula sp. TMED11]